MCPKVSIFALRDDIARALGVEASRDVRVPILHVLEVLWQANELPYTPEQVRETLELND